MPELRNIISEIAVEVSDEDMVWSAPDPADALIAAFEAKGLAIVRADELAELRQRIPWAGGQSPIVCGASGSITSTKEKSND